MSTLSDFYIYHYTFDIDVKPGWRDRSRYAWSKRRFMGGYPPLLGSPPSQAQRSTHTFAKLMNEAMQSFGDGWRPAH